MLAGLECGQPAGRPFSPDVLPADLQLTPFDEALRRRHGWSVPELEEAVKAALSRR
jgi:hypothetical protein